MQTEEVAEISRALRNSQTVSTTVTAGNVISPWTTEGAAIGGHSRFQIKIEMSGADVRIKANADVLPAWFFPTIKSVGELIVRGRKYEIPSVNLSTVKFAFELLPVFMNDESPPPIVASTGEGGLSFHWRNVNLALYIPQATHAYFEDAGVRCVRINESIEDEVELLRKRLLELPSFTEGHGSENWLGLAKASLDQMRRLGPGWDQERAQPISPRIIDTAVILAATLAKWTSIAPKVVPLSEGTIQFEWRRGKRLLAIEVESQSSIHYLKWNPDTGDSDEGSLPLSDRAGIAQLLNWFKGAEEHAETAVGPAEG